MKDQNYELSEEIDADWIALICCRVSDRSQLRGSGLDSQEHRCRQHAEINGYPVEAVFLEAFSGGQSLLKRPAIRQLIAHIDANAASGKDYVVIFDDHKRFARQTENHLKLRRMLKERGVRVEFLNFRPEETPEGKFSETVFAAQAQLEREQNARQSRQKSIARLEKGYAVQAVPPIGYKYVQSPAGGKELVRDEPYASIVGEALEGYASGRFASQVEVKRFLELQPEFPKDLPGGQIRQFKVVRMLRQKLYAGYVGMPQWGVSIRDGQHAGLISKATFERIQNRLDGRVYAPARKDIREDFPLRGAVSCASCSTPLTSGWSKGKYKKYPYYFCRTKGCERFGKSIARGKIEDAFKDVLSEAKPTDGVLKAAAAMFHDYWSAQSSLAKDRAASVKAELAKGERQVAQLVDRLVDATNPRVAIALEKRIDELERNQLILREQGAQSGKPRHPKRELFELSLRFLSNPCILWESGRFELQRLVLKLVFPEHLTYCKEQGFLNTKFSLPFKALGGKNMRMKQMVPRERIELSTSSLPMMRSTTELPRLPCTKASN